MLEPADPGHHFMMKINTVTHLWEPVSNEGAPTGNWQSLNEVPAGVFSQTPHAAWEPAQSLVYLLKVVWQLVMTPSQQHWVSAGVVHQGILHIPRINRHHGGTDLLLYDFSTKEWGHISCHHPSPAGCLDQLVALHGDTLIRIGRKH